MICTECGKRGATLRRDDASGEEHHFHAACWREFAWWLAGHRGLAGARCEAPLCQPCRRPSQPAVGALPW